MRAGYGVCPRGAELEQLRKLEAKVDEDHQQLVHLKATLEQERSS
jgi:hypothetical protein